MKKEKNIFPDKLSSEKTIQTHEENTINEMDISMRYGNKYALN